MKKIGFILVVVLILTLSLSVIACDNNKTNSGNNGGASNNPNSGSDGFITASTTIEDLSDDLVKSLFRSAKTASEAQLKNDPCIHWHIEMDVLINDSASVCVFEINFDKRDRSKTEMKLLITRKNETEPFVSIYYFQGEPQDDKNPGTLYFQYGDAKVKVPVTDTFLGELFPISFNMVDGNTAEEKIVSGFLSANLVTKGNIQYKYKYVADEQCVRNYAFQVDMKATLVNIINMLKSGSWLEETYESVSWIIESLFGVKVSEINTKLPSVLLSVDLTTLGARNQLDKGFISNLRINASVAASDEKDSIFRGESYKITLELLEFKAIHKLNEDFPKEDSAWFKDYISYDDTALVINGALVYLDDEDTIYDITIGFRYDWETGDQSQDEGKLVITEQNNPQNKLLELYAFEGKAYFNFYCATGGEWVETTFDFDIDKFIQKMTEIGFAGDSDGFLRTVAYAFGAIQVWEDGSLSLKINEKFYEGILNLDSSTLVAGVKYASDSSQIEEQFGKHNTTLEKVLSDLVINKQVLLIFDNGDNSIDTTNKLVDKE